MTGSKRRWVGLSRFLHYACIATAVGLSERPAGTVYRKLGWECYRQRSEIAVRRIQSHSHTQKHSPSLEAQSCCEASMSRAIATARLHSIEASPAVRCTCHRSRLACRCSRTSRSGRRTLLDQAEQSFRKALDGARQASMVHGLLEVRGRGCMRERCESAAEACPSQAQAMQQSRSAHLLSIRLEQHGLRSTPRRMSTWSSRNAVVFLSWRSEPREVVILIGFVKALRSSMRNRELHRTTESFCASDGRRRRQSRKTADLVKIVIINQIHTT